MQGGDGRRGVLLAAVGLAGAVAAFGVLLRQAEPAGPAPAPAVAGADPARVAALEERVARLERELAALRDRPAPPPPDPPARATEAPVRRPALEPVERAQRPVAPPDDARALLERYVRSFEGGGGGSEYFRLAVDAYAPELLPDLCRLVRDPRSPVALRAALVAIVAGPRFARDPSVQDAVLALLRSGEPELTHHALDALERFADPSVAPLLEELVWTSAAPEAHARLLDVLVSVSGPQANRVLQRLFATARDAGQRASVVAALSTVDPDLALAVLTDASRAETEVRLQAAYALQRFHGFAAAALVEEWLAREGDEMVRLALQEARTQTSTVRPYSAQKAVGPPDADPARDDPNAWASLLSDGGEAWLELTYEPPLRASGLRVHEVLVPGAVCRVVLTLESGATVEAWAGDDPTTVPGVLELSFPVTDERVRAVRVVLDTDRRPGWSEIDAVQLTGPDGSAWASGASASSEWGQ